MIPVQLQIIQAIDEAEISVKSNQTSLQLKRLLYPLLGSSGSYVLPFSNQVYHPSNTFWGAVTSGKFGYYDSANTLWDECRVQDNNGTLEVYRTSGEDRIIVNNNVCSPLVTFAVPDTTIQCSALW